MMMNTRMVLSLLAASIMLVAQPSLACGTNTRALRRQLEAEQATLSTTATSSTSSTCERECLTTWEPVCGSDGVSATTYANRCAFRVAKCKSGGALQLVVKKACPTDRVFCSTIFCGKTQSCITHNDGASQPFSYCADLCDASHCGANELCVTRQVACINAPCPEQKSCVPNVAA